MPKKRFNPAAPGDLVIEWRGMWKDMTVSYQGRQIGDFADKKELTSGKDFALPDGSQLRVHLKQGVGNVALEVTRDGMPVGGSDGDPEVQVKTVFLGLGFATSKKSRRALGVPMVEAFGAMGKRAA